MATQADQNACRNKALKPKIDADRQQDWHALILRFDEAVFHREKNGGNRHTAHTQQMVLACATAMSVWRHAAC